MPDDLRRSPLYDRQKALGARFVPFAGWEMPVQYVGVTHEHHAARAAAGLFDVSHMGELFVSGSGAPAALDRLVSNDVARMPSGHALYTVCCNAQGTILDDLIVYRLAETRFLVVCNASNRDKISAHFARELAAVTGTAPALRGGADSGTAPALRGGADSGTAPALRGGASVCTFSDESDDYALLALQGPQAPHVIERLDARSAVPKLPRFGVSETKLGGIDVIAARTGYTGEDGFELFCAMSDAGALWDALMRAGAEFGIAPIGLGARDTLRLEARLMLYGNDIDETTNPYEAGIGWTVKLGKGDFIGRAALERAKHDGVARKLVGFEMVGRGIARHGYPIVDRTGSPVGIVTSGAPSLSLGKHIGLGYVPAALSTLGTAIGVEIRGNIIEAVVVRTPFYTRGQAVSPDKRS